MVYVFLNEGFEPIEALTPVDMMRRAGIEVTTVALDDDYLVQGAHGIPVQADDMFCNTDFSDAEMLVLPGGPGTPGYLKHKDFCRLVKEFAAKGGLISAICWAPGILARLGVLDGRNATVYPGCDEGIKTVHFTGAFTEKDGNFLTAVGPAAASAFGAEIIEILKGAEVRKAVCKAMQFKD